MGYVPSFNDSRVVFQQVAKLTVGWINAEFERVRSAIENCKHVLGLELQRKSDIEDVANCEDIDSTTTGRLRNCENVAAHFLQTRVT